MSFDDACYYAGSMFETNKRWRVPYLLYLLAVIMLGEVAFNGKRPVEPPFTGSTG